MKTQNKTKSKTTKSNGIPTGKKKPVVPRVQRWEDEKFTGSEPMWNETIVNNMDEQQYTVSLIHSMNFYNYYFTSKDLKKYVIDWLKSNDTLTDTDLAIYKKSADGDTPITLCSLIKANNAGMPLKPEHTEYIVKTVKAIVSNYIQPETDTNPKSTYTPSIQDRMNEKLNSIISDIEYQIDLVFKNNEPEFKLYSYLVSNTVPVASLVKIISVIEKLNNELTLAESNTDEQLTESYSFLSKKDFKRIHAYLTSILSDISTYGTLKKTLKKAKTPTPPSKDKLVSKLKYMKESAILKIASINPVSIIGCQELWCYNTKTRKLGLYIADSTIGYLGISGTSITGYDVEKSICKTLRKPELQLNELLKAGKVQLRKFLDTITSVDTKLSGRISDEVILLKVQ